MEELFNVLSASARFDKSRRGKKRVRDEGRGLNADHDEVNAAAGDGMSSRDRTGKRDNSEEKRRQVHKEQIASFRRSMSIQVANKHDPELPDPISSFEELKAPNWWKTQRDVYQKVYNAIKRNIEIGRWKDPTAIQMQAIPILLQRRDLIGAAPTGSGKSGAFIIPALVLSSASGHTYHGYEQDALSSSKKQKKKNDDKAESKRNKYSSDGRIRSLILAPSKELAEQLHREVERLGSGKPGGVSSMLLSKSNSPHVIAGNAGGKHGLDVLVSTPMRLVDALDKGLRLDAVRLVCLDEADRLLDAADGNHNTPASNASSSHEKSNDSMSAPKKGKKFKETTTGEQTNQASGSRHSQTFLDQMDRILASVPASSVRALFSATVTPTVRSLAESVLRNPVDLKIGGPSSVGGANTDIKQTLTFVGREEGKLLAMRQLVQRGELKPPVIVFVQSQERAQALFGELLYDGIHVDVIHAGRSQAARHNAVARFRKGDSWVLICTDLVARGVDFRAVNMVINYDLPSSGITYVHRIGRCGRAGRKGTAITLFTESDFDNLRTIANVMKQSGCEVEDWMLQLRKRQAPIAPRRPEIETTPLYDKRKQRKKEAMIRKSKKEKKQP